MKKNEKNKLIKSYAEAFYEAAATSSLSEKVFAETEDFVDFLEKDTKLMKYLSGPLLKDSDKKEILVDITEKKNFSQPIVGLVKTMADNGRAALLSEVLKAYTGVYYAKNNISQVNVQTAIELSEEQKNKISMSKKGKKGHSLTDEQKRAISMRMKTIGVKKSSIEALKTSNLERQVSILQFDLTGKLIKEWEGINLAARKTNSQASLIHKCCNGQRFKHNGFIWKYKKDVL